MRVDLRGECEGEQREECRLPGKGIAVRRATLLGDPRCPVSAIRPSSHACGREMRCVYARGLGAGRSRPA